MAVYYNEHDPFAAAWLRELIARRVIPAGDVDTRDIRDVRPADLDGYRHCHFFAGIGGWAHALQLAEWDRRETVWTGSCPCQPFSAAGKGGGFIDERHLWPDWHWLIEQCAPAIVFGEQVASPAGLAWLDLVSSDLEATGYTVGAVDLCSASVKATDNRPRVWFVAYADCTVAGHRWIQRGGAELQSDRDASLGAPWSDCEWVECTDGKTRPIEPGLKPLDHGLPARMGRLRGYGNAINPWVAKAFIEVASEVLSD